MKLKFKVFLSFVLGICHISTLGISAIGSDTESEAVDVVTEIADNIGVIDATDDDETEAVDVVTDEAVHSDGQTGDNAKRFSETEEESACADDGEGSFAFSDGSWADYEDALARSRRRHSEKHHSEKHHSKNHHSRKHHSKKHHSKKHHSEKHHSEKHHSRKHHSKKHHSARNHHAKTRITICSNFSELIERLRAKQKGDGGRTQNKTQCKYWVNTALSTDGIGLKNVWFGEGLQCVGVQSSDSVVVLLPISPSVFCGKNVDELKNIILNESNWEVRDITLAQKGAYCPTFEGYLERLKSTCAIVSE